MIFVIYNFKTISDEELFTLYFIDWFSIYC